MVLHVGYDINDCKPSIRFIVANEVIVFLALSKTSNVFVFMKHVCVYGGHAKSFQ